jgi:hypothetical protein
LVAIKKSLRRARIAKKKKKTGIEVECISQLSRLPVLKAMTMYSPPRREAMSRWRELLRFRGELLAKIEEVI